MSNAGEQSLITQSFRQSWRAMELFYAKLIIWQNQERLVPIYQLICLLQHGYCEYIRAGQSLNTLILSRAKEHGGYKENIMISARSDNKFDVFYYNGEIQQIDVLDQLFDPEFLKLDARLQDFLEQLKNCPLT